MSHICSYCKKVYTRKGDLTKHTNAQTCRKSTSKSSESANSALRSRVFDSAFGPTVRIGKCWCCHSRDIKVDESDWEMGHIVSKNCSGSDGIENRRPICRQCNSSMGDEYMLDYMNRCGYVISDDLKKFDRQNEVKIAFELLKKAYAKLVDLISFADTTARTDITGLLKFIINLTNIAIDTEFHTLQFSWIFTFDVLFEKQGMPIIDTYQESMYERSDLESFKRIVDALDVALNPYDELVGHGEMIHNIQIAYIICLIHYSRNKHKWKKVCSELKRHKKQYFRIIGNANVFTSTSLSQLAIESTPQPTSKMFDKFTDGIISMFKSTKNEIIVSEQPLYTTDTLYSAAFKTFVGYV